MKKLKNLKRSNRFLLILSLCGISLMGYSQNPVPDDHSKKNEIGTTLISLKQNFGLVFNVNKYYFSKFSGVSYKRYFGKNAVRVGYDFCDRWDKTSGGDMNGTSSYRENRFRIGYQRLFGNKRIKPFVATDFTLIYSKSQGEFQGGYTGTYQKGNSEYYGYGFAPAVGFSVNLTHNLSLTVEASLEFLWINETGTYSDRYDGKEAVNVKSTDYATRENPLNIVSINYAF